MNIKSLLLGSAAALIAVSGARAADAVVVAEPEPAEYVKICDVYGSGYFYIPGTETCLRIGGFVRYDIGVGDREGVQNVPDHLDPTDRNDTYYKNARFTLKTWTNQETELGTLKTFTETRFNFGNGSGDYDDQAAPFPAGYDPAGWQAHNKTPSLNFAWIQLGGLRVGKDESAFNTFNGYAGNVIDDTLVPYGSFDTNVVQYYFDAGNGFSAVVSLEEGAGADTIDSYVPHVVGGVKYTQGWGSISGVVGYDSNYESWAGKARLDVTVNDAISAFVMAGYGSDSDVTDPNTGHSFFKLWDGSWAVWGGASYKFNEKASFNVQASYDDGKTFGLAANVAYDVVPGFTVTAEVDYFNKADSDWHGSSDGVGGILRFQRSF
ncbi:porin [Mesorhizobium sp. M4B.F.Ca.ET.215.01.1.1]|uniref:porin n=3 Tax=Mesorhizobium TaxID=68287 RepID=UPI000FCA730F|nr:MULTISPECIES: porin [unclassified Mesorhizobium]RVD40686.1 porin [Mesorhizobium sp. M4B.F.Ca.ET.019.03.1.1]RWF66247.1 MAG: porin [Mesorhizobium sp.]TGQ13208.1 porin [Mesorhizobium sp. M4B.F.Ca.ET.215.01.1.1]TGQ43520.1 porin [Mesorhizobium sp. M4B.F.Ca.ET.214.01.1.1]TGQ46174.1 porin [Mesorhizobium sp. M00.F.Ca.ET.220.01.1.1]